MASIKGPIKFTPGEIPEKIKEYVSVFGMKTPFSNLEASDYENWFKNKDYEGNVLSVKKIKKQVLKEELYDS